LAKSKQRILKTIILPIFVLTLGSAIIYFVTSYLNKPRFVRYPGFEINMPVNYSIHGIDVSHHQGAIDWDDVKAMQVKNIKIGFAFIKATESTGFVDEAFRRNWFAAKKANMPRGAYHFFNANKSGKIQATNFTQNVILQKGDMPPVLDVETTNGVSKLLIQQHVEDWLVQVENYYGVRPIIYTNVSFYENYLAGAFDNYPLWAAHYLAPEKPRVSRNWALWQHNETGRVNGIDAFVDFNAFNGDSADFKNMLMK
jgi:lysozyme